MKKDLQEKTNLSQDTLTGTKIELLKFIQCIASYWFHVSKDSVQNCKYSFNTGWAVKNGYLKTKF